MLKNYIKTTLRSLSKNSVFTTINTIGLALGMSAALIIFHYVAFESSFDDFHTKSDQIFRLELKREFNGLETGTLTAPMPLASEVKQIPQVKEVIRFVNRDYLNNSLIYQNEQEVEVQETEGVFYADPDFEKVFDFEMTQGSLSKFTEPFKVILTETLANNLFKDENPIHQTVTLSNNIGAKEYEVIAVLKDLPVNSHFNFNILLSMPSYPKTEGDDALDSWGSWNGITFFLLHDAEQKSLFHSALDKILLNHPSITEGNGTWSTELDPLKSLHFDDNNSEGFKALGDNTSVLALKIIGLFILIVAWINYINLSTAQVIERAREVGVRKVLGSSTVQLRIQFLLEAFVLNVAAAILAFTFVQLAFPLLKGTSNPMIISDQQFIPFWSAVVSIILVGALLSGVYPAFVLSSFRISKALSGKGEKGNSGFGLRKFLVVFQFAASIILIAGTITIYKQIRFMKSADLGLNIDNVLVLNPPPGSLVDETTFFDELNSFKQELKQYSFVHNMTTSSMIPGRRVTWGSGGIQRVNDQNELDRSLPLIACDKDFHTTYDIELLAGRYYKSGDGTFSKGDFIINRKAAELLGFETPEDAIGEKLTGGHMFPELTIVGVVSDIHHRSLQAEKAPLAFVLSQWSNYYSIKFNEIQDNESKDQLASLKANVEDVKTVWSKFFPNAPFDYFFLDKAFDDQYKSDEEFGFIFLLFSTLAIAIASMGLLGLSAKSIAQRTKEIGIRKVLGASTFRLTSMLTKEYLRLILIAGVVAIPLSWYLLTQWLENYAHQIAIGWWIGLIPLVLVLLFSLAVVGIQTMKAASKNPVDSLKYE